MKVYPSILTQLGVDLVVDYFRTALRRGGVDEDARD